MQEKCKTMLRNYNTLEKLISFLLVSFRLKKVSLLSAASASLELFTRSAELSSYPRLKTPRAGPSNFFSQPETPSRSDTESQSRPPKTVTSQFFSQHETPKSSKPKFRFRHISKTNVAEDKEMSLSE